MRNNVKVQGDGGPVLLCAHGFGCNQDMWNLVTPALTDTFCSTDLAVAKVSARATFFTNNRANLPRVSCPSLLLQHRNDNLAPLGVGDYLHAQWPHSTLRVLDVAGHCAHLSNPALAIDEMRGYMSPASSGG